MYLHPNAGGVRLEIARRGVRIGTAIPPENESDQRATTVLNAILRWPRGPESIRLRKATLRTYAPVLGCSRLF